MRSKDHYNVREGEACLHGVPSRGIWQAVVSCLIWEGVPLGSAARFASPIYQKIMAQAYEKKWAPERIVAEILSTTQGIGQVVSQLAPGKERTSPVTGTRPASEKIPPTERKTLVTTPPGSPVQTIKPTPFLQAGYQAPALGLYKEKGPRLEQNMKTFSETYGPGVFDPSGLLPIVIPRLLDYKEALARTPRQDVDSAARVWAPFLKKDLDYLAPKGTLTKEQIKGLLSRLVQPMDRYVNL